MKMHSQILLILLVILNLTRVHAVSFHPYPFLSPYDSAIKLQAAGVDINDPNINFHVISWFADTYSKHSTNLDFLPPLPHLETGHCVLYVEGLFNSILPLYFKDTVKKFQKKGWPFVHMAPVSSAATSRENGKEIHAEVISLKHSGSCQTFSFITHSKGWSDTQEFLKLLSETSVVKLSDVHAVIGIQPAAMGSALATYVLHTNHFISRIVDFFGKHDTMVELSENHTHPQPLVVGPRYAIIGSYLDESNIHQDGLVPIPLLLQLFSLNYFNDAIKARDAHGTLNDGIIDLYSQVSVLNTPVTILGISVGPHGLGAGKFPGLFSENVVSTLSIHKTLIDYIIEYPHSVQALEARR